MTLHTCNLVIMDAGPLIKLAIANKLDLLLSFHRNIFIPDEVCFEAVEKFAWENKTPMTPDKIRLKKWNAKQQKNNQVTVVETYIGSSAKRDRKSGRLDPVNYPKELGKTAATHFFLNRNKSAFTLALIEDCPFVDATKIQVLDVLVLTTYAMLRS